MPSINTNSKKCNIIYNNLAEIEINFGLEVPNGINDLW